MGPNKYNFDKRLPLALIIKLEKLMKIWEESQAKVLQNKKN